MSEPNNPFAGLVGSEVSAVETSLVDDNASFQTNSKISPGEEDTETINNIVENVFHFTINPNAGEGYPAGDRQLVFLEELAEATKPQVFLDLEALEQALFERLLLTDIEKYVIPKTSRVYMEHVIQKQIFPYLFSSIQNLQSYEQVSAPIVKTAVQRMKELIFRNAVTALKQPALFEGQDFSLQLVELLQHVDPQCHTFFIDIVKAFMSDGKLLLPYYFLDLLFNLIVYFLLTHIKLNTNFLFH